MGRYYYSKKEEADSLKKIQMWWLKKHGYIEKGCWKSGGIKWTNGWTGKESNIIFYINIDINNNDNYLQLVYSSTTDSIKEDLDYKIPLTSTPCYFGGVRYWFICPWFANGKYCGRRAGVLYLGGKYFACRHCYNLSYESRNENRRFKDFPLFAVITGMQKKEDLQDAIKRKYYNGKPTRRQKALDRLENRLMPYQLAVIRKQYA